MIYISAVTGLSVTAQLYSGSSPLGSPFAATEIGTTGEYTANVPGGTPYGYYLVLALASPTVKIASGDLYWDGSEEMSPQLYEELHRLQGLKAGVPMHVTPTSRTVGDINLAITGDGVTETIVSR